MNPGSSFMAAGTRWEREREAIATATRVGQPSDVVPPLPVPPPRPARRRRPRCDAAIRLKGFPAGYHRASRPGRRPGSTAADCDPHQAGPGETRLATAIATGTLIGCHRRGDHRRRAGETHSGSGSRFGSPSVEAISSACCQPRLGPGRLGAPHFPAEGSQSPSLPRRVTPCRDRAPWSPYPRCWLPTFDAPTTTRR